MDSAPPIASAASSRADRIVSLARRVGAAICLAGVVLAARDDFAAHWVAVIVIGALIVATGPAYWIAPDRLPGLLPWPSASTVRRRLLPAWLLLMATAPAKLLGAPPQILVWGWLAGLCWVLFAAWQVSAKTSADTDASYTRATWVWVAVILTTAFVLRAWSIGTIPREVHGDETATAYRALAFYANPARDWFGADILMNFLYAVAGWGMLIFDVSLLGARLSDVVLGTLSTILLFDTLRRVSTPRVAIVAALLLATNHVHIAYSRNAASYIQSAFVVALLLAVAARVWVAPSYFSAVLLGVVAGIGIQTVPASVAALPFLAITLVLLSGLRPAHARRLLVPLVLAAISCVAVAAPFTAGMWQHRTGLMSRTNDISIFSANKMSQLKVTYKTDSVPEVVARQVWVGLTGFQFGRNAQPQYATQRPLADGYTAALLIAGVVFAVLRLRQFVAASTLIFTAGYLVVGLGLYHAMGFQRAVGALPSGIALMAIGLVQCAETLCAGRARLAGWARNLLLAVVVIGCGWINLHIYFVQCRTSVLFSDARSEAQWVAREFAHAYHVHLVDWLPPGFDDAPLVTGHLPISWNKPRDPVVYAQSAETNGADLFVLHSDDRAARDVLLSRFPGARVETRRRHPAYGPTLVLLFVGDAGVRLEVNRPPPGGLRKLSMAVFDAVEEYVQREYGNGRSAR